MAFLDEVAFVFLKILNCLLNFVDFLKGLLWVSFDLFYLDIKVILGFFPLSIIEVFLLWCNFKIIDFDLPSLPYFIILLSEGHEIDVCIFKFIVFLILLGFYLRFSFVLVILSILLLI